VLDYSLDASASEPDGSRGVRVIAGLSGVATRGTLRALASGLVERSGSGIVIELKDETGDGVFESITVIASTP
jgi:hypothetical protein